MVKKLCRLALASALVFPLAAFAQAGQEICNWISKCAHYFGLRCWCCGSLDLWLTALVAKWHSHFHQKALRLCVGFCGGNDANVETNVALDLVELNFRED